MEERKGTWEERVTDLLMSEVLEAPRLEIVDFSIPKEIAPSISPSIYLAIAVVPWTFTTVRSLGDLSSINFTS